MLRNNIIKVICFSILLLSSTSHTYAENLFDNQEDQTFIQTTTQKIKFGPQIGTGILTGSLRLGIVGEYRIVEWLGIQTGILHFRNQYFLKGIFPNTNETLASVIPQYITIPVILRNYPKPNRKRSFFAGLHIGYLLGGSVEWHETMFTRKYIAGLPLHNIQLAAKNLSYALVLGSDHEFKYGITIGLTFIYELTKVIETDEAALNWTLAPTLSYNLGTFLKQSLSSTNLPNSTKHFYDLEEYD
jgi:hypothetical protein